MNFPRSSGILLHPTSLPGGDLGAAYWFVDWLEQAGQAYWQILPLNLVPTGWSPYSALSAFGGNTSLISAAKLADDGLIDEGSVGNAREDVLGEAFERFRAGGESEMRGTYDGFARENVWWLDDLALFIALKNAHEGKAWAEWAAPLRMRERDALDKARVQWKREIEAVKFAQFLFFEQWAAVKAYANERGVRIIGDIPIFVAYDSADVWCNQQLFKLDVNGRPTVVAGVPPDFFSETGQLWGNPIYDWQAMREDGFGWWTARLAWTLRTVDIVRLDHFIGFAHNWEVPADDDTAVNGQWVDVPGRQLFAAVTARLGELPVIVEDLGAVTPAVEAIREECGFPGMRILQNAFGGDAWNRDLPHNYIQHCVAYTGTHDNDTARGWFKNAPKNVRHHLRKYLNSNGRDVHWDMMRAVWSSIADTAITPAQDILGLGSEARMNTPATVDGNWKWQLGDGQLDDELAGRLREMTELFGRVQS
jgi:4-alpha-glucanotransferase